MYDSVFPFQIMAPDAWSHETITNRMKIVAATALAGACVAYGWYALLTANGQPGRVLFITEDASTMREFSDVLRTFERACMVK